MEFNRRDLLKFFSAGAIITPVVNGLTLESDRVELITTPEVKIVEPPKIVAVSSIGIGEYDATVYLRNRITQEVTRWESQCSALDINLGFEHMVRDEVTHKQKALLRFSGEPKGWPKARR